MGFNVLTVCDRRDRDVPPKPHPSGCPWGVGCRRTRPLGESRGPFVGQSDTPHGPRPGGRRRGGSESFPPTPPFSWGLGTGCERGAPDHGRDGRCRASPVGGRCDSGKDPLLRFHSVPSPASLCRRPHDGSPLRPPLPGPGPGPVRVGHTRVGNSYLLEVFKVVARATTVPGSGTTVLTFSTRPSSGWDPRHPGTVVMVGRRGSWE